MPTNPPYTLVVERGEGPNPLCKKYPVSSVEEAACLMNGQRPERGAYDKWDIFVTVQDQTYLYESFLVNSLQNSDRQYIGGELDKIVQNILAMHAHKGGHPQPGQIVPNRPHNLTAWKEHWKEHWKAQSA